MPDATAALDSVQFTVTYDGPALVDGRMDARTLGAAMLDMAKLLESSMAVTNGTNAAINVEIVADFKGGSFSFKVVTAALEAAIASNLLHTVRMGDLLAFIGLTGGGGLIGLIKWLRGRKIDKVEKVEPQSNVHGDNLRITAGDDTTIVQGGTFLLFNNSTVRVNLDGVVAPLRCDGITDFRSGYDRPEVMVGKEEVEYFDPPIPDGALMQDKTEEHEIVQLVDPSFDPNHKWRFKLADGTVFFSHIDDAFKRQVFEQDVRFGYGDALIVTLHTRVLRDPSGTLRATREIVRVEDHLKPGQVTGQLNLLDHP